MKFNECLLNILLCNISVFSPNFPPIFIPHNYSNTLTIFWKEKKKVPFIVSDTFGLIFSLYMM